MAVATLRKKKVWIDMKIINRNAKGEIIKDLSKITLNEVLSEELRTLMINGRNEQCQKAEQANA